MIIGILFCNVRNNEDKKYNSNTLYKKSNLSLTFRCYNKCMNLILLTKFC